VLQTAFVVERVFHARADLDTSERSSNSNARTLRRRDAIDVQMQSSENE